MTRPIWIGSLLLVAMSAMLFLFVSCFEQPVSPYQPQFTKIVLQAKSPTLKMKLDQLVDSVGNPINLGFTSNLPYFIDSVIIKICTDAGIVEDYLVLKNLKIDSTTADTTWCQMNLGNDGTKLLIAQAYIQQNYKYLDTLKIVVYKKNVVATPRGKPQLAVSGITTITVAQTCSLSVTALDSNVTQTHTFYVKQDTLPFTVFTPPFRWIPPAGFIGNHAVTFKVTDADSPSYFDTTTKTIIVSDTATAKTGPHWTSKALVFPTAEGSTFSLLLTDKVSGDSLTFILVPGLPAKDTIIGNTYSYTFAANDTNNYFPQIIAKDKKGNVDTVTFHLWEDKPANVPPKANDQNLSTKKNTAIAVTLTADPIDGDSLYDWKVVLSPANGDLTGTAPALTYTPKAGFLGTDSLTFTVSDGKNTSNTAKIKINVSDVLAAPVVGKTIADTAVNKGLPIALVATVNLDANPSPMFSWIKEGVTAPVASIQTFTINKTVYSDQGRYRYFVTNSQGKDSSNWITFTVKDVTKPVITLKGANPQNILLGAGYTELGDSAYDDKDGIITSRVVIDTSKVKTSQTGTYPVTYSVKDSAGNIADTLTRSVQISGTAPL